MDGAVEANGGVSVERLVAGDVRALARAATFVENHRIEARALMRELFPLTGKALVLGLTGAPGAGKSTLATGLIREWRGQGKRVAAIAVDPSSPFSGGAILGDRIRMMEHHADEGVFIRSMANRGRLGGVAAATSDMTMLCEAAGFDVVLVETVGVGQAEVDVARVVGVTAVVVVPGMGDGVQALKAGILEAASVLVVNKCDHAGAADFVGSLRGEFPATPLVETTASAGRGIRELADVLEQRKQEGAGRAQLWRWRMREMLLEQLAEGISEARLQEAAELVAGGGGDPYRIVEEWVGFPRG